MTSKTILFLSLAVCFLLGAAPISAKSSPLHMKQEIWSFTDSQGNIRSMSIDVGLDIQGLWGPIPDNDPTLDYLQETFDPKNERYGYAGQNAQEFIMLAAYQGQGRPVRIQVHCPSPEELGTLRSSEKETYYFFRPTKRRIAFDIIREEKGGQREEYAQLIDFQEETESGLISWVPASVQRRDQRVTCAPEILQIEVTYSGTYGLVVEGNPKANWDKKASKKLRLAWLVLPVCGNEYGRHILRCPAGMGQIAEWQIRNLGEFSLAVPDTWDQDLSPEKDQGIWEMDSSRPPAAELVLARVEDTQELLQYMQVEAEESTRINGLSATRLSGRIPNRKVQAVVYHLKDKDAQKRHVLLAGVARDWDDTGPLLEAAMHSLSKGDQAVLPEVSPDPVGPDAAPLNIQSGPKIGQSHGDGPPDVQAGSLQETETVDEPKIKEERAAKAITARLLRSRQFMDLVGRGERLGPDGSVDDRFVLEVTAPNRVITHLAIKNVTGQTSAWDTVPENGAWLLAVTEGNRVMNAQDGSISLHLPAGAQRFDLWVQDNNSISGGQSTYSLTVTFADGQKRSVQVEDEAGLR